MPDKRRKCGNNCLRCWRNKMKHANKNTGNKSLDFNYNCQENDHTIKDIYSLFIDDYFDIELMKKNYIEILIKGELPIKNKNMSRINQNIDNQTDIESMVYLYYKYWILQNSNTTEKYISKNKLIYEIKYRLGIIIDTWKDDSNTWIIKSINSLQYHGSKEIKIHDKCSICFNNSNIITDCEHYFCKKCLIQWNIKSCEFNCPYCRNEDIKLYKII